MWLGTSKKGGNKHSGHTFKPISMKGQEVEQVSQFKYLGTVIDSQLQFQDHVDYTFKKGRQRLALLRKLRGLNTSQRTMSMVYKSLTESVLTFNIVSWYGYLSVKQKNKLAQIVNQAGKIIGYKQLQLPHLHTQALTKKAHQVYLDPTHPLHGAFQMLPSGRRLKIPMARKNGYKRSFVPSAVAILNKELFIITESRSSTVF